jgi:hypothetical protein
VGDERFISRSPSDVAVVSGLVLEPVGVPASGGGSARGRVLVAFLVCLDDDGLSKQEEG